MKRILVVDDNEDLADGLSMILDDEGYDVVSAYTGEMALEKSADSGFDIAIIDIKLPDTTGVDLFVKMRERYPQSRIILMTGYRIEQILETVSNGNPVAVLRSLASRENLQETLNTLGNGILLLDNQEQEYAEWLKQTIESQNKKVAVVSNREQALDAMEQSPDVLVFELENSIVSTLADYISVRDAVGNIPVLLHVGNKLVKENGSDPLRSFRVTGCIYKPFDPDQIMEFIRLAA